jgi:hypothetical protein
MDRLPILLLIERERKAAERDAWTASGGDTVVNESTCGHD